MLQEVDINTDTAGHGPQTVLEDWLTVLSRLWTSYGKPLEPERLQEYQRMLQIVPLGLLEKAIDRVVREHTFNSVPTVGEVWFAVRKELGNPLDIEQAIEAWCEQSWHRCVVHFDGVAVETEAAE